MSEFEERSRAHSRAQTDAMMVYIEAERRVKELKDENTKLRELVEDMLDCIDIQIAFERVPARRMQDEFAGRAHELGIEVER